MATSYTIHSSSLTPQLTQAVMTTGETKREKNCFTMPFVTRNKYDNMSRDNHKHFSRNCGWKM